MTFRKFAAGAAIVILAIALALFSIIPKPTNDPSVVRAIKAESAALMAAEHPGVYQQIPTNRWPPVIASLKPESVALDPEGVTIRTKAFFDDGWGYFVPRDPRQPPAPAFQYSALGHGVYWFHFS